MCWREESDRGSFLLQSRWVWIPILCDAVCWTLLVIVAGDHSRILFVNHSWQHPLSTTHRVVLFAARGSFTNSRNEAALRLWFRMSRKSRKSRKKRVHNTRSNARETPSILLVILCLFKESWITLVCHFGWISGVPRVIAAFAQSNDSWRFLFFHICFNKDK